MNRTRAAWIDVELENIVHNVKAVQALAQKDAGRPVMAMPVIKGNAYGHGIFEVARILGEGGGHLFRGPAGPAGGSPGQGADSWLYASGYDGGDRPLRHPPLRIYLRTGPDSLPAGPGPGQDRLHPHQGGHRHAPPGL